MEQFDYREAREYAMKLGLAAGGLWIASFLLFVYSFPTLLAEFAYGVGLASFVVVGMRLRKMRKVTEGMTLFRTWWLAWATFMFAMLLTTFVQYIYFGFFDHGHMVESILTLLRSREVTQAYAEMKATATLIQMKEMVKELAEVPVKELVMSFMTSNIVLGLIFSVMSALWTIGAGKGPSNSPRGEF